MKNTDDRSSTSSYEQASDHAPVALITGASSQLGAAFARRLAAQGYRLVLTSRHLDGLAAVAEDVESRYRVVTETLVADLAEFAERQRVIDRLVDPRYPVQMLVNNAGVGLAADFADSDWETEARMIEVNFTAPMHLIHGALPAFLRRGGRIVNVCSIAGLFPDGSYGATKAGLVAFSRWAHARYHADGVNVTALCPGLLDTDFHVNSGVDVSHRPKWSFTEVDQVALEGLAAVHKGDPLCIPGRTAKLLARSAKVLPNRLVASIARKRPLTGSSEQD
ncbi:SDR family NAD(P)-dependent oxidoreductase [Auritidibacter ignavus]|uniref:SDR family NAD(P)-dependent oxidoreductase n=1 Tax=Auritidibacter ignavus TaxID=678932 RepID=UPI002447DA15|nr:SDR family NAD(P)-dependent oxidoreductase [Auritidibacter ignavus]WGH83609.1 SDR family NAD(P)-dependent oxidoreductase [Auritidibacter ignavus]